MVRILLLLAAGPVAGEMDVPSIIAAYRSMRRHPELFDDAEGWRRWIAPGLLDAVAQLRDGNASAVWRLLREEGAPSRASAAYSFAVFSDEFCDLLLSELDGFYASGLPISRPNSMNNYGIIVNHIGLQPVISTLQRTVLQPLADLLYPEQAAGGFDGHHSFMVRYRAEEDLGLDMHTDDSDVTFNFCLGRNFTGAALTLCGDSRTPDHRQFAHSYTHVRGRALVHLGSRRHGADNIHTGERNSLIVWNQNQRHRRSAAYVNRQPYEAEAAPPDPRCLSFTHDRDFGAFLDYPRGKEAFRGGGWCPPAQACYDSMASVEREVARRERAARGRDEL